ncbi:hypothetical protein OB2597_01972 [Pseudooceanicola batsensis HTCC2597]|uniref:Uncharacterized protein n=1 Tax=Pseudooceanicola batsensis (strain ATCC BAA-863 / DSM 15984 / KCTC 12145 / HTCC2597) TaxID=252305 RepID=A3TWY8_PSEBH|nr:hypothetical protein [Pseudooceanicola batsensis]EAQ03348.1 hypothetical protein OB2597_01972 [Pseudooceanicola batsensis HTCC2597]
MFGIVLWSNRNSEKAVIWCEDQGDLAMLDVAEAMAPDAPVPSPGDLLRLELHADEKVRRVSNACLVVAEHYPAIANVLGRAADGRPEGAERPRDEQSQTGRGNVVALPGAFSRRRCDRERRIARLHG